MALAALALYLLGLLLALGMRTLTACRRTGDTGFRRPDTTAFTAPWWGSVLFGCALIVGLAAPVVALFDPATAAPHPSVGVTGPAVMLLLGLTLILVSQATMGASWRISAAEDSPPSLMENATCIRSRRCHSISASR